MSGTLPSGHTYEELEGEELEILQQRYPVYRKGIILANPGNFYFPKPFVKFAKAIYEFEVKPSDVYVLAYPKSGTNWIQEIVWNLVNNPDLNNPDADISIDTRCPFFEVDFIFDFGDGASFSSFDKKGDFLKTFYQHFPEKHPTDGIFLHLASVAPEPRLLKDHLPYVFLPQEMLTKAKAICIARDPRDVIVSGYHFQKLHSATNFKGTLEEFVNDFITDRVPVPFGPYWEHLRLHWEIRNHPNFLLLFYEDLKENPTSEFKKIDKFLGTNRSDEQIENIIRYTSFSNMKEKTKDNPPTSFDNSLFKKEEVEKGKSFFRKGKVGSWREDLPLHLQEKVNDWMKENLTRFSDDFKYKKQFQE